METNMHQITIYFDGTLTNFTIHKVKCNCPIDWVMNNYHCNDFYDFTYYSI